MPKQIENIEEIIIKKGRELLFKDGYSAFSMRQLAKECGIAVGTIYNYIKNKDELAARIAICDWHNTVDSIYDGLKEVSDLSAAMSLISNEIRKFRDLYKEFFFSYSAENDARIKLSEYHPHFRDEIIGFLDPFIPENLSESSVRILGELVLISATRPDISDDDLIEFINLLKL